MVGNRDVRNKPILEALPELKGQGFDTLAREVMRTGKSYIGREALVKLNRRGTGQLEDTYFTFIYSPISGEGGENHSVAVIATEVTDQVRARRQLEILANEATSGQEKFRRLSESLDVEVRARTGNSSRATPKTSNKQTNSATSPSAFSKHRTTNAGASRENSTTVPGKS